MSYVGGSQQLRQFRISMREGASIEVAAQESGILLGEARLIIAEDKRNPPPEEAFVLLHPRFTTEEEEPTVATAAKQDAEPAGEYKRPNAERAFEIYDKQIKPKKAHLATIRGDLSDPFALIKDECNFPRKILDLIVFLEEQEDAKRDHMLLALSEGLKLRKLFMPRDLVTIANGEEETSIVPAGERPRPQLATIMGQPATGDETDLADVGAEIAVGGDPKDGSDGDDGAFEATEAEIAQQAGRGKGRKKAATKVGEGFVQPLH